MNDIDVSEKGGEACSKRVWVMMMLSDDEAMEAGGELPRGLQFHLSRCESCQTLAGQLKAVSDALHPLSKLEPSDELASRANNQALAALSEGTKLTGRVTIPDDPLADLPERTVSAWRRAGRYVAAAGVILAAGLLGLSQLGQPRGTAPVTTTDAGGSPAVPSPSPGEPGSRGADRAEYGSSSHVGEAPGSAVVLGRATNEGGEDVATASLADVTDATAPPGRGPRPICDYHSYVEAAMRDDVGCVHRAVILPRRGERNLGWGNTLFDNRASTVSTKPRRVDE